MTGIIILLFFTLFTLIFIQNVTAVITASSNRFHAEIDYSIVTLILNNSNTKSKEKRKHKKAKQRLTSMLSLPASLNFLLARSKITINSLTAPMAASDPHEFFTRYSLLCSAASLIFSLLLSKAKEFTVTDEALNFSKERPLSHAFSINFTIVFTLYNLILFGLIFLFESIKRRIKNARKQNE